MTRTDLIAETESLTDAIFSGEFATVATRLAEYIAAGELAERDIAILRVLIIALGGNLSDVQADDVAALLFDTFEF